MMQGLTTRVQAHYGAEQTEQECLQLWNIWISKKPRPSCDAILGKLTAEKQHDQHG